MTSIITFCPALGAVEHIHGRQSQSRLVHSQPPSVDFLFSAELSATDYDNLVVRDGARLQIWTNIPRLEDEDANEHAWREIEFVDPEALQQEMRPYRKVSLQIPAENMRLEPTKPVNGSRILLLAIAIPSSRPRQFSFTYRVVYPSGRMTWLGFYERNGAIVVDSEQSCTVPSSPRIISYAENLLLRGKWILDSSSASGTGFVMTAENVDLLEVSKVNDMASTRIWALGKDRLLRQASALIIVPVPKRQSLSDSILFYPSYIFSASSGASLSVSSSGGVTVSGTGTLQLSVLNCLCDPGSVVEAALRHSELNGSWTLLGSDSRTRTAVLACTGNGLPIPAVVVSFGTPWSNFSSLPTSLLIPTSRLAALVKKQTPSRRTIKEFTIFPSTKATAHIFNVDDSNEIVLEVDTSHSKFTESHTFIFTPVYHLPTPRQHSGVSSYLGRQWGAAILTSYTLLPPPRPEIASVASPSTVPTTNGGLPDIQTMTDARGLLTPPPSPPMPPTFGGKADVPTLTPTLLQTPTRANEPSQAQDNATPFKYEVRRRRPANTAPMNAAQGTEASYLKVNSTVPRTFERTSSRGQSPVRHTFAQPPPKRATSKHQRSSCLMWIFRAVFKCLFASVRVFLRVAFNIRLVLVWGVGLVVRGPGFAWGLLWGAGTGTRPARLSTQSSSNAVAPERSSRMENAYSRTLTSSGYLPQTHAQGNTTDCCSESASHISDKHPSRDEHAADSKAKDMEGGSWDVDVLQRLQQEPQEPVRPPAIVVSDPVFRNLDAVLDSRSDLYDCQGKGDNLPAEITPLCLNGTGTVEVALMSLDPPETAYSEKDTQSLHDATTTKRPDIDTALLQRAINFNSSRHPYDESTSTASKKSAHPASSIRPVKVHSVLHPSPSISQSSDTWTASSSSILASSTDKETVEGQKKLSNEDLLLQEAPNTHYAVPGFILRYELPRDALDQETGAIMVSVGPPNRSA